MTRKQYVKAVKRPGRRPSGKVTVQLRVLASTKAVLERLAHARKQSPSQYADELLQRHFEQLSPPDFVKRFARPPEGPPLGDDLVRLILSERES